MSRARMGLGFPALNAVALVWVASGCSGSPQDTDGAAAPDPTGVTEPSPAPDGQGGSPPVGTGGPPADDGTLGGQSSAGPACSAGVTQRIYRLSVAQYGNALSELLKLPASPLVSGDTEAFGAFFPSDMAAVQSGLASGFSDAVTAALDSIDMGAFTGCAGAADVSACSRDFLADFAARAFGRPLALVDTDRLLDGAMSPFVVGSLLDVNNGVRLSLEAILQAPSFVYRRELGTTSGAPLDAFETATQLGFVLRNSLPDEPLRQAAINGELVTDEQILAQFDRMLQLSDVQANLTRIVGGWFAVDRVLSASKDPTMFPGFNAGNLQRALADSAGMFIQNVLWTGQGTLLDLLTSPTVFFNQPLAAAYGVPFNGQTPDEFVAVNLQGQRAGILTQPAIAAGNANSLETSIVRRGLFMVNNALCLPSPPPPPSDPNVTSQISAQLADGTQSEREKADFRAVTSPCLTCHALIDPYGDSLEIYDAIGRYRTTDELGRAVNAMTPVPESLVLAPAQFADDPDGIEVVADALALVQGLTQSTQFATCAGRQMLSYTLGQQVAAGCDVVPVVGPVSLSMTVPEIFRRLVVSNLVRQRIAPTGGQ